MAYIVNKPKYDQVVSELNKVNTSGPKAKEITANKHMKAEDINNLIDNAIAIKNYKSTSIPESSMRFAKLSSKKTENDLITDDFLQLIEDAKAIKNYCTCNCNYCSCDCNYTPPCSCDKHCTDCRTDCRSDCGRDCTSDCRRRDCSCDCDECGRDCGSDCGCDRCRDCGYCGSTDHG